MKSSGGRRPRVVLVTRATEYDGLLERHGTREQARFYLAGRGGTLDAIEARHAELQTVLQAARRAVPPQWRFNRVDRGDLATFVFEPDDFVLVVGQDGLVANVAKYLDGQTVTGVDPAPGRNPGVLVTRRTTDLEPMLEAWQAERLPCEQRTMVEVRLDDGQVLSALNEIFLGHRGHQSARYRVELGDRAEEHSSSGVIVSTGTGATGWALSIARERQTRVELPAPTERRVAFFVREAWPSPTTGTAIGAGVLDDDAALALTSRMNEGGVIFGDGIEGDRIDFAWGRRAEVRVAPRVLRLAR